MKSLPFYVPEAEKRYPFRGRIGHKREYTLPLPPRFSLQPWVSRCPNPSPPPPLLYAPSWASRERHKGIIGRGHDLRLRVIKSSTNTNKVVGLCKPNLSQLLARYKYQRMDWAISKGKSKWCSIDWEELKEKICLFPGDKLLTIRKLKLRKIFCPPLIEKRPKNTK